MGDLRRQLPLIPPGSYSFHPVERAPREEREKTFRANIVNLGPLQHTSNPAHPSCTDAMKDSDKTEGSMPPGRLRARRLRLAGALILIVGLTAAGTVYWLGTRAPDLPDDPSMIGFDRAAKRQIGILYGRFGEFTEDLTEYLKRPGVQASIIILVSAGVAFGCFRFAHLLEYENEF